MQDKPNAVMMFAAGRGTRMAPLTDLVPKPLIRVAGCAMIDHALGLVGDRAPIVVNTHYLGDQVVGHLADRNVITIHEEILLETGGGLRNALPLLGPAPVFTMNTDAVWHGPNVLDALYKAWNPQEMDALLALIPLENAVGHKGKGDFIPNDLGQLQRGQGQVYTGVQIIKTDRFASVSEDVFSMNIIWDQIMQDERLFGIQYDGQWCDVGRPENIELAEAMLNV